ncbi:MAG: Flp family type IVb pilin [Actinomycetota bacterium]
MLHDHDAEHDAHRHGGDERGASLVEYALLISLMVLVTVGALAIFGSETSNPYSEVVSLMDP